MIVFRFENRYKKVYSHSFYWLILLELGSPEISVAIDTGFSREPLGCVLGVALSATGETRLCWLNWGVWGGSKLGSLCKYNSGNWCSGEALKEFELAGTPSPWNSKKLSLESLLTIILFSWGLAHRVLVSWVSCPISSSSPEIRRSFSRVGVWSVLCSFLSGLATRLWAKLAPLHGSFTSSPSAANLIKAVLPGSC